MRGHGAANPLAREKMFCHRGEEKKSFLHISCKQFPGSHLGKTLSDLTAGDTQQPDTVVASAPTSSPGEGGREKQEASGREAVGPSPAARCWRGKALAEQMPQEAARENKRGNSRAVSAAILGARQLF